MVVIENDFLSLTFDKTKGNILSLYDKNKKIEFIQPELCADPFRLEWHSKFDTAFESFDYKRDEESNGGTGFVLTWDIKPGVKVYGRIVLLEGKNELLFYSEVENDTEEEIYSLEYPVIPNLRNISPRGEKDYLAHSFATGFLIHNPMCNFSGNWEGLRFMPYPEGFSGSTMQFFTYYGQAIGGLYFAAYDGEYFSKWLNFYKNGNGFLEASFIHGNEDIRPCKGIKTEYPIVIKTLLEADWYEAADIYKKWAIAQKWCNKGVLSKQKEDLKAKWLLESAGLSTFGINAMHDRTKWINKYHELVDTSIFHVLGPDWPRTDQNYFNHLPGGLEDWFPARFNKENLGLFEKYNDKFAPFEFDYLFNFSGDKGIDGKKAEQIMPPKPKSVDTYKFPFLCPYADFTKELHVMRDEYLEKKYKIDAIYYDISANNILKVCHDKSHGHKVGGGKEITEAYRENYLRTKAEMIKAGGKYVPMGTEMINEVFLDTLDFYQARAGAQPCTAFEGWPIRNLIISGEAELIPMFTYVYHEYGPVRMDGWGYLADETGDLFYYTAARTYLWGGLYELNYEYVPMEEVDGGINSSDDHYYQFEPINYKLVEERGKYLHQFAKIRTGEGNRYLSYGVMEKPLTLNAKKIDLNWKVLNAGKNVIEYHDQGIQEVDSIINSVWKYNSESLGIFFSNINEKAQNISFTLDMKKYGIRRKSMKVRLICGDSIKDMGNIDGTGSKAYELEIPPRSVIMLEAC